MWNTVSVCLRVCVTSRNFIFNVLSPGEFMFPGWLGSVCRFLCCRMTLTVLQFPCVCVHFCSHTLQCVVETLSLETSEFTHPTLALFMCERLWRASVYCKLHTVLRRGTWNTLFVLTFHNLPDKCMLVLTHQTLVRACVRAVWWLLPWYSYRVRHSLFLSPTPWCSISL